MIIKRLILGSFLALICFSFTIFGQAEMPDLGIRKDQNLAVGVVKIVGDEKIVLETKDGVIDVILLSVTNYKRLPPDNISLKAATDASLSEIGTGDRVLVTGKISEDSSNILTKTVYLVKSSDLKAQQEKERQEWITRGINGRIITVDIEKKEIDVEMRGITGLATTVKLTPKEDAVFLRYSESSVKYQDAVESRLADIQPGDMLRAIGDRSEDQKTFSAERILTGAFLTVAGTVKSIDEDRNEVTITDLKTKSDVTIIVNKDSLLKKFPEEIAQRLARAQMMGMQGGRVRPPGGGNQPPAGGAREGRGGLGGGMRGGDINEMLNRFPTIKVSDLKAGDMIAASSPKGKNPNRLTAIKLLAGVEPFLKAPQMPAGRRGRGSTEGGISIPGLDGADF